MGFAGPLSGAKHQFMVMGEARLTVPSNNEYSVPHLRMMIKQEESILGREIDADLWNSL